VRCELDARSTSRVVEDFGHYAHTGVRILGAWAARDQLQREQMQLAGETKCTRGPTKIPSAKTEQ
jgi:hypothetical protein